MEGRDQGVESLENEIIQDIINGVDDLKLQDLLTPHGTIIPDKTEIYYQFNFFNPQSPN